MDFGRDDYNRYFAGIESPIGDNEPVFMLRGLDPDAPAVMMDYCKALMLQGSFDVAQSVFNHVRKVIQYQKSEGTKHPDLVRVSDDVLQAEARVAEIIANIEVTHSLSKSEYDQLLADMNLAYGSDSFFTLLPADLADPADPNSPLTPGAASGLEKARLALRIQSGSWIVIKNTL